MGGTDRQNVIVFGLKKIARLVKWMVELTCAYVRWLRWPLRSRRLLETSDSPLVKNFDALLRVLTDHLLLRIVTAQYTALK